MEYGQINTNLLLRLVEHVEKIEGLLGTSATGQSSVEVKTSTRGVDVAIKVYTNSPVRPAGDEAVAEYLRVRQSIEDSLMGVGVA